MTKKADEGQRVRWKGDEVEDQPADQAEQAAARAEGNQPVRADAESRRAESPDSEGQPQDQKRRPPRDGDPEQDIADAADEHQARRNPAERPPRGKL
jgi:hypothetical protein